MYDGPVTAGVLLHAGQFTWDELLLFLLPLVIGLVVFWALSKKKGPEDGPEEPLPDAPDGTPQQAEPRD